MSRKLIGTLVGRANELRPVCKKCKSREGVFKLQGRWVCQCLTVQIKGHGDAVPIRTIFPNRRARRAHKAA